MHLVILPWNGHKLHRGGRAKPCGWDIRYDSEF